tara:strand:+ start:3675 stop:3836 length:162 start_codon:yes stop_codon:yes gene_type:complete
VNARDLNDRISKLEKKLEELEENSQEVKERLDNMDMNWCLIHDRLKTLEDREE